MWNGLDDPGQRAIRIESHPLNPELVVLVIGDVHLQMLKIHLALLLTGRWDAHVVVLHDSLAFQTDSRRVLALSILDRGRAQRGITPSALELTSIGT